MADYRHLDSNHRHGDHDYHNACREYRESRYHDYAQRAYADSRDRWISGYYNDKPEAIRYDGIDVPGRYRR